MENKFTPIAKVFRALCDEKRLAILEILRNGQQCACDLTDLGKIPQSALSYHMKILCESGIVNAQKSGRWTHYSLSAEGSRYAAQLLSDLTTPADADAVPVFTLTQLAQEA